MRLKIIQLGLLILLFSVVASAFDLELIENSYLPNTSIVANLKMIIDNNTKTDSNIIIKIDDKEITRTTLKDLMDLNQVRYNVTESRFLLGSNSFKTRTLNNNAFLGIRVPPGVINLVDVIVSGNNAREPTIDIGNDNSEEWIFLGNKSSFNPPITGSGVNLGGESGNFILSTINNYLCSLIDLPLTKDIKVEAKYKLSDAAKTGGNITATLFGIGQDGTSATGGSDSCDMPEPNTNSEFRSCIMRLSLVAKGEYYVCLNTKSDRTDGADLYSIPIDDKPDSSFLCAGDVNTGQLVCAKAQGGDFFIRVSTGDYNKILNGNTNFGEWLTFPESIKLSIQSQLTNCNENCIIPIKTKLNGGSLNINKFLVRSGSFETDSMFDGVFQEQRFSIINNANVSNRINLSLSLSKLSLNTTNMSFGVHRIKLKFGDIENNKTFTVASIAISSRFNSIKNNLKFAEGSLEELLSKSPDLLNKIGKKAEVESTINALKLKTTELNSIENQTIASSEKDKRAEEIFNNTNMLIDKLPKAVFNRGKASDKQVINLKDLKDISNFDDKDLFFEQKRISTQISMDVVEALSFSGIKELKTFLNIEATANEDLEEAEFILLIPNSLRNVIKGTELNHEKGIKITKGLNNGEKLNFALNLEGSQLKSFYDFKVIYIPNSITPSVTSSCGNKVCEIPLENKFTCPVDCEIKFPVKPMLILIIVAIVICLIVFIFTMGKPFKVIAKIKGLFIKSDGLTSIENYISNCLKKNISEDKIRKALSMKSWSKRDIDVAFKKIRNK